MVCMFGPTSDEYGFLHRGTRVRKMHSSYRSTFRTIGDTPLATVTRKGVKPIKQTYNHRRKDRNVTILPYFEEKISIVYYYPNMQPDIIDSLVENGYKGIVIAGTGLGHVNKPIYSAIERAAKKRCTYLYDCSNPLGVCSYVCLRYRPGFNGHGRCPC